jgi:hypothetical protein
VSRRRSEAGRYWQILRRAGDILGTRNTFVTNGAQRKAPLCGALVKRTTGFEPATFGLGNLNTRPSPLLSGLPAALRCAEFDCEPPSWEHGWNTTAATALPPGRRRTFAWAEIGWRKGQRPPLRATGDAADVGEMPGLQPKQEQRARAAEVVELNLRSAHRFPREWRVAGSIVVKPRTHLGQGGNGIKKRGAVVGQETGDRRQAGVCGLVGLEARGDAAGFEGAVARRLPSGDRSIVSANWLAGSSAPSSPQPADTGSSRRRYCAPRWRRPAA